MGLYPIKKAVIDRGEPVDDTVRADLMRLRERAQDALGAMNLFLPDRLLPLMREALLSRADFTLSLMRNDVPKTELELKWRHSWDTYRTFRAVVRSELGVDGTD